jgi:hypothetical protein
MSPHMNNKLKFNLLVQQFENIIFGNTIEK